MAFVKVCAVHDLKSGEALKFAASRPIAVFRIDDKFYATDDTCTHAEGSLSEGYLDGDVVECAFHGAKFCIRTGKVLSLPASQPIKSYPVRLEADAVLVDVE
ncbi:MAG: bifunctional 3-phenylpropionate/cinnamic acid dioxygenase ferredoxin subunit [Candidatus Binataceae bacterium]